MIIVPGTDDEWKNVPKSPPIDYIVLALEKPLQQKASFKLIKKYPWIFFLEVFQTLKMILIDFP